MGAVSREALTGQLREMGVREGGVLLVHTSFRAVRPVDGGPQGLVDALLDAVGPGGTLVMPSWSGEDDRIFDPRESPADVDLGVVAETFRRMPGVQRSTHPFAFAARGPHAREVVEGPLPLPPHAPDSPVGAVHRLDGQILLLGVGHDADTTLHLAELLAGVPYRVPKSVTVEKEGHPVRVEYGENDHCCRRFALADGWLRAEGLQREGSVGHAPARLVRSQDVVRVALTRLREDPLLFLHGAEEGCADCDEARESVGGLDGG